MAVVLDASLLLALVSGDPRADAASARLAGWLASGEGLHAPALTPFEVASGLTRLVAAGAMWSSFDDCTKSRVQGRLKTVLRSASMSGRSAGSSVPSSSLR